jgi:hypothetical protein
LTIIAASTNSTAAVIHLVGWDSFTTDASRAAGSVVVVVLMNYSVRPVVMSRSRSPNHGLPATAGCAAVHGHLQTAAYG